MTRKNHSLFSLKLLLLVVLVLCLHKVRSQSLTTGTNEVVSLDSAVRFGKLDNGFSYYIRRNDYPENRIELRLVIKAGRLNEDEDQDEIAHLLEHMAFNGTRHYPGSSMVDFFEKNGLTPRAITTSDATKYGLTLSDPTPELVDNCLRIMRDWAQEIALDSLEVDKERGVIVAEYTKSESETSKLDFKINSRILNHPRYPENPTLDLVKNVKSFKHSSLVRFFKDWYRPDLEAIIVVGDVDVLEFERKIMTLFADLKMPVHVRRNITERDISSKYSVSLTGENHVFTFLEDFIEKPTIEIFLKKRASLISIKTYNDVKELAKDDLFNEMVAKRIRRLVNRYNSPLSSVSCGLSRNAIHPHARIDAFQIRMSINDNMPVEAAIQSILNELTNIKRFGFSSFELDRAKVKLLTRYAYKEPLTSGTLATNYANHFSTGAASNIKYKSQLVHGFIKQAPLEDINRMAKKWIDFSVNRDVIIKMPVDRNTAPAPDAIEKWVKGAKNKTSPVLPTTTEIRQLIEDVSDFKKDDFKITEIEELGINEIVLSNQTKIILKSLKPQGVEAEKILIYGFSQGGASLYEDSKQITARNAGSIIGHAGVGDYDQFQLKEYLSPRGISANVSIQDTVSTLSGYCNKLEMEALLQYVYLKLTRPRKDIEAFRDWRMQQVNDQMVNNVNYNDLFLDFISENSYLSSFKKDINHDILGDISLNLAYQIYRERFVESGPWTFIVTGDFDPEIIAPLISKYFSRLPSNKKEAKDVLVKKDEKVAGTSSVSLQRDSKIFYRGKNEKAVVHILLPNEVESTLAVRLKLELLANILHDRIWARLREQEGAAYDCKASSTFTKGYDNIHAFYIYFQCETDDVNRLIAAALEEFKKIRKNGIDATSYEKALGRVKGNTLLVDKTKNRFWLDYLSHKILTKGDLSEILKRDTILTEVINLDALNKAANKYIDDSNAQSFVWLPQ